MKRSTATATRLPLRCASVLLAVLATGCTVGPDPQRPRTVADDATAYVHAPDGERSGTSTHANLPVDPTLELIDRWWIGFGDPATEQLVDAALAGNQDLRAAAARVLEARARLGVARSSRWPSVDLTLSAQRQKNSFVLPDIGRVDIYSTTYSPDLSVAYQVDLFGRLRRSRQAAWSDLLAQEAARESVVHTVISETVRARVRLSTLDEGLRLATSIRDSWESTLRSIERRYNAGLTGALDLRLARENAASARARVVDLEAQRAQAALALDVLVGRRPGTGPAPDTTLTPLPDLTPVPLGLPAALLDRRPDLRQAELELAAATARVGVAVADLFPQLSLTGSTGIRSDTLDDLLSNDLVFNLIGNLVTPLFDGGRRRDEVDAAKARAEAAAARYAGAVLQALREVEDALVRDDSLRRRLDLLDERVEEARAADRIARERYRRGVETLLRVLETERRLRAAEEALVAARAVAWTTRIDLFLALGGDWTSDEPSQTNTPQPDTSQTDTASSTEAT
ncbi:MAG: efflux transporter outer membrane subunit [Acidobacteriota bacterium]